MGSALTLVINWRDPEGLRRWKNVLALVVGLVLAAAVVAVVDVYLGMLADRREQVIVRRGDFWGKFMRFDDDLGYRIDPNAHGVAVMEAKGLQIYEVEYTSDEFGRRITPTNDMSRKHEGFLLFFGGSHTFGTGVQNDETLPSRTALLAPDYHVYNYADGGYGPSQTLAMLEAGEIPGQVQERQGIAIYTFRASHAMRVVGGMRSTTRWAGHFPYYALDAEDKVVRMGSFNDRPFLTPLYRAVSKSGIVRFAGIDVPLVLRKSHFELTVRILEESMRLLERDFASVDFYVVVYPSQEKYWSSITPVVSLLKAAGITVLDYRDLLDLGSGEYFIDEEYEQHPSPKSYQEVAARLVSDLGIVVE